MQGTEKYKYEVVIEKSPDEPFWQVYVDHIGTGCKTAVNFHDVLDTDNEAMTRWGARRLARKACRADARRLRRIPKEHASERFTYFA